MLESELEFLLSLPEDLVVSLPFGFDDFSIYHLLVIDVFVHLITISLYLTEESSKS
jgi:hypothetical protein